MGGWRRRWLLLLRPCRRLLPWWRRCRLSISWQLDAEPRPAILVLPPGAASLDEAEAAIELWEHYRRRKLDPTQRLAVHVMMAQDSAGMWAARTTGREMPRQNGKGDEIEVVELWGLVQRAEAILQIGRAHV